LNNTAVTQIELTPYHILENIPNFEMCI